MGEEIKRIEEAVETNKETIDSLCQSAETVGEILKVLKAKVVHF